MNLQENISRIKEMMGLIIEDTEPQLVKIYSDGGGSDDAAEYEGEVISIPVKNTIPNEPFKDLTYMENSKVINLMIKSINSGDKLPPIKVIEHPYDSSKYLVVDGNHRRYAFSKSDKENIDAVVVPHKDVLLMKNKWGEKPEEYVRLTDVLDNKKVINKYFVKPDNTNDFEIIEIKENSYSTRKHMKLNEDNYSVDDAKVLEKILNKQMPKKYPWWKHIDIEELEFHESINVFGRKNNQTIIIHGTLYVDSVWAREEWEEFTYDSPFPAYLDNLRLTTIINSGEIDEIFSEIKRYCQIIDDKEIKKVKDSHLIVKLVNKDF